ncbi:MAG: PAS domain S-box protein [Ignavibacteriales bacterium]|nr:PAS domain S-box protein [Ignavibacteriales bacterium]
MNEEKFPYRFLIFFFIAAIVISISGYLYFQQRKAEIEKEYVNQISVIKEIKLSQITTEQRQRIKLIESLISASSANEMFKTIFAAKNMDKVIQEFSLWSEEIKKDFEFYNISLFNKDGSSVYSIVDQHIFSKDFLKEELRELFKTDTSFTSNLYIRNNSNLIQAIASPIFENKKILGFVWVEISFFEYFDQLINLTSNGKGIVEFILAKEDGSSAFYLRNFIENGQNVIRTIPLQKNDRVKLKSSNNNEGFISDILINGSKIFASIKKLPGTDWNLIAKIDEEQVTESTRSVASIAVISVLVLILFSAVITYLVWRRSKISFAKTTKVIKREKDILSERYSSLTKYANDAILTIDSNGKILEANQKASEIYGYTNEEFKNLTFNQFFLVEDLENKKVMDSNFASSGTLLETNHIRKDGSIFPVEISAKYIFQEGADILLAIVRDHTERKKLEDELIAAKENAEEMNRLKTYFLSNISHELRTPMSGILGFSEILSSEVENESLREMAALINSNAKRLNETLDSLLDLSILESKKLKLDFYPVSLNKVIASCVETFSKDAKDKSVQINYHPSNENLFVRCEPKMLVKLFSNVIDNAIKYSEKGEINIIVKSLNGNCEVNISDEGIGIQPDQLEKIFEPFRQGSEGFTRKFEGTGLGLTITKKFVDILGGILKIKSKPQTGTTVTIRLPLCEEVKSARFNQEEVQDMGAKNNSESIPNVLLVEDDEASAKYVKLVLAKHYNLEIVNTPQKAISRVKEKSFAAILMDIGLRGDLDGIETALVIRKIESYKKIPIVALTAFALESDKERILKNGCSHFLSKPFKKEELLNLLNRVVD